MGVFDYTLGVGFVGKLWEVNDAVVLFNIMLILWCVGWQTGAQLLSSNEQWPDQARTSVFTWSGLSVEAEPANILEVVTRHKLN